MDLTSCPSDVAPASSSSGAAAQPAAAASTASVAAWQAPPSARYASHTLASLVPASTASRAAASSGATSGNPSPLDGGSASPLELLVAAITDLQRRVAELEDMCVEVDEEDLMDDDVPEKSSKRTRL